ncbi:MAG: RNase adapter RapZ [Deltaproteobacteria bacterium]|nr:MAG: RNase adapter RapZ [Deltaproteobacteria bacterium]
MKNIKIIIITGLSGSGKTTAINALEDAGFFCIDNLPVILLPKFLELRAETGSEITKLALVMDLREKEFLRRYHDIFTKLREDGYLFEILFLEASTEILLRRYSQTRRKHPLSRDRSLPEGIQAEREELKELKEIADHIIDTSNYNVHELKEIILSHVLKALPGKGMKIYILSFGFKYGIPHDADLVLDVRFLPNPYFVQELKSLDGTSSRVKEYMDRYKGTHIFMKKYLDLLNYIIPLYEKEGKSSLTIAVGCTAGRHRSVSIADNIFKELKRTKDLIALTHRDIELDR